MEISKTSMWFPKDLLKDMKRHAIDTDSNVRTLVIRACYEFLAKEKKQ